MKQGKSYTSIWTVEKMLYAVNDVVLPFPVTFQQIGCFFLGLLLVMFLPVFEVFENALVRYFALLGMFAWFVTKKTFDGKKPFCFLKSVILYAVRRKRTFGEKQVQFLKCVEDGEILAVSGEEEEGVSDQISFKESGVS